MFFVILFSLAALAVAEPKIHQQVVEQPNAIPFYIQIPDPTPLSGNREMRISPYSEEMTGKYPIQMSSALKKRRFFPYYTEMEESYPFQPHSYKNIMEYPHRSDYFLRYMNKPEMSVPKPKVEYDKQDYIHRHDVIHHHLFNNVHDCKQKHTIRKLDWDIDSPYLPYTPMYYNKLNTFNRGYPYGNMHYSRGLEQESFQPGANNYYNRHQDIDYIRNYHGNLNSKITRPYTYRNGDKPSLYRKMDYVQPVTSKSLDVEHVQPVTTDSLNLEYVQPVSSRSANGIDVVHVNYIHPVTSKSQHVNYIHPVTSKSGESDLFEPIRSENLGLGETHAELNHDSPVTDLRHNTATNVELSHQTPAVTEHHETIAHEQIPQEGRRQDIQLNTNLKAEASSQAEDRISNQAEDHISQQPIHRQTRDTTSQTVEDVPQYTFYLYYLYPYYKAYLPIQTAPLLTRSVLYPYLPYYYNLLLRKLVDPSRTIRSTNVENIERRLLQ